ncbi:MAG TPA: hypothetical protein VE593_07260 [Nitrososphaeraceae archaeon]|jgi:hypothetical protein|nr:hypothetical protein [Nitrososphaeraceae archaeon]
MSNPEIADWNNLIQKNVKTKDSKDLGNIIMVDDEFITILEGTRQEYVIPKKYVEEFTENEVVLNLDFKELKAYEAKKL